MKIAHRLYLTVTPAVVAVLTAAALTYWGQYQHAVPPLLLGVTWLAALGTLSVALMNARYIVRRMQRLTGVDTATKPTVSLRGMASAVAPGQVDAELDELDAIEVVVDRLSSAVAIAEQGRAEGKRQSVERSRDYARMLALVAESAAKRLEEVRLPLHILLENHFGDLNENQEEMLGAARVAAEAVDADLVAVRHIAELDSGSRTLRRDRLLPGDLGRALVPTLQAVAEKASVTLRVDIEPLIPAMSGDQAQLQDALATILGESIGAGREGSELELTFARIDHQVALTLRGAAIGTPTIRTLLASRIIMASGGTVDRGDGALTLTFPLSSQPQA